MQRTVVTTSIDLPASNQRISPSPECRFPMQSTTQSHALTLKHATCGRRWFGRRLQRCVSDAMYEVLAWVWLCIYGEICRAAVSSHPVRQPPRTITASTKGARRWIVGLGWQYGCMHRRLDCSPHQCWQLSPSKAFGSPHCLQACTKRLKGYR